MLVCPLAHDSGVILPIALYQFGGKEVAVILAHQCLWGEGEIRRQQAVARDVAESGVFEQHPIGKLIHHLGQQQRRGGERISQWVGECTGGEEFGHLIPPCLQVD